MPDLNFSITSGAISPFAAIPTLDFALTVTNTDQTKFIQTIVLRTQIRIEPQRRDYDEQAKQNLSDLFGEPSRWGLTLRPLLWTHVISTVPAFEQTVATSLPVPCTFDFNVAAAKYFYGLDDGEIPLTFLFSGTIFHTSADHNLQIAQISWDKECRYRLPVKVWREMMDHYYPNSAWLHFTATRSTSYRNTNPPAACLPGNPPSKRYSPTRK